VGSSSVGISDGGGEADGEADGEEGATALVSVDSTGGEQGTVLEAFGKTVEEAFAKAFAGGKLVSSSCACGGLCEAVDSSTQELADTMRLDTGSLATGHGRKVNEVVALVGRVAVGSSSSAFRPWSFCSA